MMRRGSSALAGFMMLVAIGGSAPSATADAARNVPIDTVFHDPGAPAFTYLMLQDCAPDHSGGCSMAFDGRTTMTGSIEGTTVYRGVGYFDGLSGVYRFEVWETFTGLVRGCGEGTLEWHGTGQGWASQVDPLTQTFPLEANLAIVDGSGRGGLSGIAGSFKAEGRSTLWAEQNGTIKGAVTCP
ncbi:MAG TPA: hypothetical protein VNE62_04765 [Actinomycetota bacterium]|nr:hypothetical protein [Actinomycetota bacterium]